MDRIAGDFVTAARFVKACGYDGVVIHGGHGFIFTQFLSPTYNKRTDAYGGSLENRARFPIQILKAIRKAKTLDAYRDASAALFRDCDLIPGGKVVLVP